VGASPLFYWLLKQVNRGELKQHLTQLAESVAAAAGLEVVEVELKGAGRAQLLRITIDKPDAGVTHADCETVSRQMSALLDAEDPIDNPYELEVSSPGVERKLMKWRDWERFQGKKAKVILKQPALGDLKYFDGIIARAAADETGSHAVTVELSDGRQVTFPVEQVDRANLKFEW
jgi:ribosome maturation factor RimP